MWHFLVDHGWCTEVEQQSLDSSFGMCPTIKSYFFLELELQQVGNTKQVVLLVMVRPWLYCTRGLVMLVEVIAFQGCVWTP